MRVEEPCGQSTQLSFASFSVLSSLARACAVSQELAMYVDVKVDESYTPKHVSIKVGNNAQDLKVRPQSTSTDPHACFHSFAGAAGGEAHHAG